MKPLFTSKTIGGRNKNVRFHSDRYLRVTFLLQFRRRYSSEKGLSHAKSLIWSLVLRSIRFVDRSSGYFIDSAKSSVEIRNFRDKDNRDKAIMQIKLTRVLDESQPDDGLAVVKQ